MYKKFLLVLLPVFLTIYCAPAKIEQNRAEYNYPAWFLYPPLENNKIYAVGICQPCLINDSSVDLAATDAYWKNVNMSGARIKSESGMSGFTSRIAHMGQNVTFRVDSSLFDIIAARDTVLEKHYFDNMLIVLVGPRSEVDKTKEYAVRDYGKWWTDVPSDGNYYYALGSTPKYYYESSSWATALNNALIELTRQISLTIKGLVKADRETVEKSYIQEGDVVLADWRVVARHYSSDNQTYHVLVRMPK